MSPQLEQEVYAHQIVKPMMAYFDQVNQLEEEVTQFRMGIVGCTSKDKLINVLEDRDEFNRESLKQQLQSRSISNI